MERSIEIQPMQWSAPADLSDTPLLDVTDLACMDDFRAALARHGKLSRFVEPSRRTCAPALQMASAGGGSPSTLAPTLSSLRWAPAAKPIIPAMTSISTPELSLRNPMCGRGGVPSSNPS